jgi:hypothetical protein
MKSRIAGLLIGIGSIGWVPDAMAASVVFKGAIAIESATAACGILPYAEQGNLFTVAYRPKDVGTNGTSTTLRLSRGGATFTDLQTTIMVCTLIDAGLTTSFQNSHCAEFVSAQDLSSSSKQFVSPLRLLRQAPATLAETTKFVSMRLQFRGFGNVAGCTVTLQGVLGN